MKEPVYGEQYLCYIKEKCIGLATFTDDVYLGDCFVKLEVNKHGRLEEVIIIPDKWLLP